MCPDISREHTVHYPEFLGFKYLYDFIRDVFYIYLGGLSICEDKNSCKILDRPIKRKISLTFLMYM